MLNLLNRVTIGLGLRAKNKGAGGALLLRDKNIFFDKDNVETDIWRKWLFGAPVNNSVVGSFALSGGAASQIFTRNIPVTAGTFALSGGVAGLVHGYVMAAAVAAFALSGGNVTTPIGHKLPATVGAFALTGNNSTLVHGYKTSTTVGSFSLSGGSIGLSHGYKATATIGSFALSGGVAGAIYRSQGSNDLRIYYLVRIGCYIDKGVYCYTQLRLANIDRNIYIYGAIG